ncbi:MAG TPA: heat-inducible transcriptional repressor HrcA [Vicinamibacterales bacterium]|nr:heat-inducible transcriptional repressor HrcA [Vicinamibacterales bacterium]
MSSTLSARSRRLLAALVREYIVTGEPVPSSALVAAAGLEVSSATVRNLLAQLEDEGFVHQPHTSAGRIPTDRGYRFYVDLLLEEPRPARSVEHVAARLREAGAGQFDVFLASVSHMLSRASRHVGFALAPAAEEAVFRQIEFVSLTSTRVLVVVVTGSGRALQKVVDLDEPWRPPELRQAANYLNSEFANLPLNDARARVVARLQEERALCDRWFGRTLALAQSTFEGLGGGSPRVFVEGTASLLGSETMHSEASIEMLRTLLQMIEEKQRLVRLLSEYIEGPGLTVVIGAEHAEPHLRPFSLVLSTYSEGGRTGTVGVIGPTRMRYSRAITVVDGVAQAISRVLRESN